MSSGSENEAKHFLESDRSTLSFWQKNGHFTQKIQNSAIKSGSWEFESSHKAHHANRKYGMEIVRMLVLAEIEIVPLFVAEFLAVSTLAIVWVALFVHFCGWTKCFFVVLFELS